MGIQEKNKDFEETGIEGLKVLNRNFPAFCQAVLQAIAEESRSCRIRKICESIWLYAAVFYKGMEEDEKVFLLGACEGSASDIGLDYKQRILKRGSDIKIEERKTENIQNTGTEFSFGVVSKVSVEWIAAYMASEEEHIHRITANVVLDILESEIDNLILIQDYKDIFKESFHKNNFMKQYIDAMRRCFTVIPDVNIITEVSLHHYEKRESCGIVYFLEDDSLIKGEKVCFAKECFLQGGFWQRDNVQGIRKLLELCRNDSILIVLGSGGKGEIIGALRKQKEWEDMQVVSVHFRGTQWELYCGKELILLYRNGSYYVDNKDEQLKLEAKCKEGDVSYDIFGELFSLMEEEAHYGALVIIAEDAKDEVDRLCVQYGRGIKLVDIKSKDEVEKEICLKTNKQENEDKLRLVLSMANLDGAIFFDYEGNCHGFSVILDGEAKVMGEKKRGARYNSAINYIANAKDKRRCAVIRSEDREKGIEIISYEQIKEKISDIRLC